jgi:hypothetical protein
VASASAALPKRRLVIPSCFTAMVASFVDGWGKPSISAAGVICRYFPIQDEEFLATHKDFPREK